MSTPTAPHRVLKKYYASESDRQRFVTNLFDSAARYHDWSCALGSFGSGQYYRRWVLLGSGLEAGMRLLDIATGTGLVARAATTVLPERGAVIGLDPSFGMLREGRPTHSALLCRAGWKIFRSPPDTSTSSAWVMRSVTWLIWGRLAECLRVLKPGGRVLLLEISRPHSIVGDGGADLPRLGVAVRHARRDRSTQAKLLMKYHYDTIVECVPPPTILEVLTSSGSWTSTIACAVADPERVPRRKPRT